MQRYAPLRQQGATTETHPMNPDQQVIDAINQADWLAQESGYEDVEELWLSDPDLFVALAQEWRQDHQVH